MFGTWQSLQVLTKDSVTVSVDGVVYYRVQNATLAVANITNADAATRLLAQTTLRNVLGTKNLAEILSDREEIAHSMQVRVLFILRRLVSGPFHDNMDASIRTYGVRGGKSSHLTALILCLCDENRGSCHSALFLRCIQSS